MIEKRLFGFLNNTPYSSSNYFIHWLPNWSWFSGSVGFWINHLAYNSFSFNLKRRFGKRPFSASRTLTNQKKNNAERISRALCFYATTRSMCFLYRTSWGASQVGYISKCKYFDSSLKIWMVSWDIFHVSVELPHCFWIETHSGFTATCLFRL